MKKHVIFGLAAMLSFSIVFASCGDDDDEETTTTTTTTDPNNNQGDQTDPNNNQGNTDSDEKYATGLTLDELKKNVWVSVDGKSASKNDQLDFNTMKRTLGDATYDIKANADGSYYFTDGADWKSGNMKFYADGNYIINAEPWTKENNVYTKVTSDGAETITFTFGESDEVVYRDIYKDGTNSAISTGTGTYTYKDGYISIYVKATTTNGLETSTENIKTVFYFDGITAWEEGKLLYQAK